MAEIKILSQEVADKIAAGEVVERPAAVVKELVENSIDAGADRITVEIKNGGIKYISIEDNGKGIPSDELEFAFLRHATSKLRDIEDLFEISTMGFRGEALASICAVAEVQVVSRTKNAAAGMCMTVKHGVPSEKAEVACNFGTTMVVENLFANVPARMKFLKKDSTEAGYITDIIGRIALAKPEIAFRYICDGKEVFSTSGDGKLKNAILNIYGLDHAKGVYEVDYTEHGVRICGVVGQKELARGNRTRQTLFVNGRYIKNHVVAKVVEEAYRNILMTGKFPFFVLNIELAPQLVDVNVHPAKTEIKFANEKEIYNIVHCAVKNALYGQQQKTEHAEPLPHTKPAVQSAATSTQERAADADKPDPRLIREFMKRTIPDAGRADEGVHSFKAPRAIDEPYFAKSSAEAKPTADVSAKMPDLKLAQEKKEQTFEKAPDETVITFDFAAEPSRKEEKTYSAVVVGQVFDTYVIMQQNDEMFLIDQHAAHERKRFEMLKSDYMAKKTSGQLLLAPIVLDVEPAELQAVRDNLKLLSDMGFSMEEFGRGSVIIRETPLIGDEEEIKSLAIEVISVLSDNRPIGLLSFEERILDMISCKYAIKANKRLSLLEMEALVRDVEELEKAGITTCPHGRPIKISFSKREIEKMFKRIV